MVSAANGGQIEAVNDAVGAPYLILDVEMELLCFSCHLDFHVHCWVVFRHMVFADGFLFLVKELGLLTNLGHWVRVLDVVGSYMYIVL
jgi:hypothetical protein